MKKNIFFALVAIFISTFALAQVSTTPEVPRNYKPKPKELLAMPDSLTQEAIFPVLGQYVVADKNGDSVTVKITLDTESKGVVWLNGLPEGKVKAVLKASPATYKIPSQKTFLNDDGVEETVEMNTNVDAATATAKKSAKKQSGKSVNGGTMIFDKDVNTIYINLGSDFDENNPSAVFDQIRNTATEANIEEVPAGKKATKKPVQKGKYYTGIKVADSNVATIQ